jgi:hypothetical protein
MASTPSTLEEDWEIEFELALSAASAASTLDDEFDNERLDV